MVDIPRQGYARKKRIKIILSSVLLLLVLIAGTWYVSRLEPALPSVDRAAIWLGDVEEGPLAIEVRGPGTLVPEVETWIAAATEGRVEKIFVLPGSTVNRDTVLLLLGNPELERDTLDAKLQWEAALAELEDLEVDLQRRSLEQQARVATVEADFREKSMQEELDEELAKSGLISNLELRVSRLSAEEASKLHQIEVERLNIDQKSVKARIEAKQAEISRLRGMYDLRFRQLDMLKVRAGIDGVLQQLTVAVGKRIPAGENLGKVAVPGRLKAQLRIPETQAKDVAIGLPASVDTRNGIIPGQVTRVDPAAQEGTVTVDISLSGELPPGARPDLNVDGIIQIDLLEDVIRMGRPPYGQADSTIGMFKLVPGTDEAVRVKVRLGRTSVSLVQVLEGLHPGDQVILSDTSEFDDQQKIRIR